MIPFIFTVLIKNITLDTVIIAVVGYVIVFASLVLLFWFFNSLPKLMKIRLRKKQQADGSAVDQEAGRGISGETIAAVSLALHLYLSEFHDQESGVITIKKVSKAYSPWSSKIYAVRNQFNRI
jgi:hypothetical protein